MIEKKKTVYIGTQISFENNSLIFKFEAERQRYTQTSIISILIQKLSNEENNIYFALLHEHLFFHSSFCFFIFPNEHSRYNLIFLLSHFYCSKHNIGVKLVC